MTGPNNQVKIKQNHINFGMLKAIQSMNRQLGTSFNLGLQSLKLDSTNIQEVISFGMEKVPSSFVRFSGSLSGLGFLSFARGILPKLMGEKYRHEEDDIVMEMADMLTNGCCGSIANSLKIKDRVIFSPPYFLLDPIRACNEEMMHKNEDNRLISYVTLNLEKESKGIFIACFDVFN